MIGKILPEAAALVVALGIINVRTAGSAPGAQHAVNKSIGILSTRGPGPRPHLLATGQVDGYIAWQPFVEVAPESGMARQPR